MKMSKIEKIILLSISSLALITSAIVPIASYLNYQNYYNNALSNRPNSNVDKTYDEPILKGINVKLQDGKEYYKNGKASPIKADFIVEGTFAISDKETYVDQINESDYNIEIPSDFAINGGTIVVTYKEFTSSITLSLVDVKLTSLYPLTMPYKIYYKVGESFDKTGLSLQAKYNDGTIIDVDKFTIENKALSLDTKNIKITFTKDNESIDYLLPITVVEEKEYNNGDILSIEVENSYVIAGNKLSNNKINLRATYASGNKLLLNDNEYSLINGDDVVKLGDDVVLKLKIKDKDYDVRINIKNTINSTKGILENGTTHDNYVSLTNDSIIKFDVTATHNFTGKINLRLKCNDKIKLNELLKLTINNSLNNINHNIKLDKNEYADLSINNVKIFRGQNNIIIKCLNSSFDLEKIEIVSTFDKLKDTTFGEFVTTNSNPEFNRENIFGEGTPASIDGFTHIQGGCSDDNYIYYLFSDELNHEAKLTKYSIEEKTFVSKSNKFNIGPSSKDWTWDSGNITLINNKIIVNDYNNKFLAFDKDTLLETSCPEFKFPDFSKSFDDWDESGTITAIEYNEVLDIYALSVRPVWWYSNSYLFFFDSEFNQIGDKIKLSSGEDIKWGGYKMRSFQSNSNYLYVVYGEETYKNAIIQTYSWQGELIKETTFNDIAPYGGNRSSPRNIVEYKGALYVSIYNDSGMNGSILYKYSYKETNIDVQSKTYIITGSSIVLENDKPILKIQGALSDLTKDDFNFTLLALKTDWEYTLQEFEMEINGGSFVVKFDLSKLSLECDYIFYFNKKDEQTYDENGNLRDGKSFIVPIETISYNGMQYKGCDIWGHAGLKIVNNNITYNSYRLENIDDKAILTINANISIDNLSEIKFVVTRFTTWATSNLDYTIKQLDDGSYDVSCDISNLEIDGKTDDGLNGGYFIELNTSTIRDKKVQLGTAPETITIGNRTYSFEEFYGNLKIVISNKE